MLAYPPSLSAGLSFHQEAVLTGQLHFFIPDVLTLENGLSLHKIAAAFADHVPTSNSVFWTRSGIRAYKGSTWVREMRGSEVHPHLWVHSKFQASLDNVRPCLKTNKQKPNFA